MNYCHKIIDELQDAGLSIVNISEYIGIRVYSTKRRGYKYKPVDRYVLDKCVLLVKWGVPFHEICSKYISTNPNIIYNAVKYLIQPLNLHIIVKSCFILLKIHGIPVRHIMELIKPLGTLPNRMTIQNVTKGIEIARLDSQKAYYDQRKQEVGLIKYIQKHNIPSDYTGLFLLMELFPSSLPKTISKCLIDAQNKVIARCIICNKEFIADSTSAKFCKSCKRKIK